MRIRTVLLAIPAVIVLLAPPAAHAEWYGQSRYRHAPRYASRMWWHI